MTTESPKFRSDVQALIDKAVTAAKSEDALRFSQAACNAANALICSVNTEIAKKQLK